MLNIEVEEREVEPIKHNLISHQMPRGALQLDRTGACSTRADSSA